jgi:hypothetical protein
MQIIENTQCASLGFKHKSTVRDDRSNLFIARLSIGKQVGSDAILLDIASPTPMTQV